MQIRPAVPGEVMDECARQRSPEERASVVRPYLGFRTRRVPDAVFCHHSGWTVRRWVRRAPHIHAFVVAGGRDALVVVQFAIDVNPEPAGFIACDRDVRPYISED